MVPSRLWRASPQFWIEKIRHIGEIVNSMHEHGGFELVCSDWSTAAKQECVAELDGLTEALNRWKSQLQDDLSNSTQPLDPIPEPAELRKPTHLRIASSGPAPRVLSLRPGKRL